MRPDGLPPPPPGCLWRPHSSNTKRKGGTLIVEDVGDREAHDRLLRDPDGYRPGVCLACGRHRLHVHDYVGRKVCLIVLVRYRCPACGATWRMLPVFVARMLWRSWPVVEAETIGPPPPPSAPRVPARTVRRWRARLAAAAWLLLGVLRKRGEATHVAAAVAAGEQATRIDLVVVFAAITETPEGQQLARVAAVIHRMAMGVRLM